MQDVRIRLDINREAAIRAGKPQFGSVIVCVDVAILTDAEREELLRCPAPYDQVFDPTRLDDADQRIVGYDTQIKLLDIADPTIDSIRAVLNSRRAAILALGEAARAKVEESIRAALAKADEAWLREGSRYCEVNVPTEHFDYYLRNRVQKDARIVERYERLDIIAKARTAAKQRALQEQQEAAEAKRMAVVNERKAWIAEHGSAHLQRLVAAGIEHQARYADERLAMERPDWEWLSDNCETEEPTSDCPAAALDLLDAVTRDATIVAPRLRIVYEKEEEGYDSVHYYAVIADFLGETIVTKQSIDM